LWSGELRVLVAFNHREAEDDRSASARVDSLGASLRLTFWADDKASAIQTSFGLKYIQQKDWIWASKKGLSYLHAYT
jgi:hypothetical protein